MRLNVLCAHLKRITVWPSQGHNLDLAQSTFKRMEELASKKSISNQEFD